MVFEMRVQTPPRLTPFHPGFLAWMLLAWTLSTFAGASETLKRIQDNRTVVVAFMGVVDNLSPFVMIESDGEVSGYSIDICLKIIQGIRQELKLPYLKVQFFPVDMNTRFSALLNNRADLECSVSTNNADRRKQFSFTIPHFFTNVRMLVRTNSGIKNWNDLRNKRIVTTRSTGITDIVTKRSNIAALNLSLTELDSDLECVRMLEQGLADAFIMDEILLYGARASANNPDKLSIAGASLSVEPYAIMFRKDDPGFKKMIDRQMAKLVASGEIVRLYNRWFMQPIGPDRRSLNLPMSYMLRDSLRYPTDKISN